MDSPAGRTVHHGTQAVMQSGHDRLRQFRENLEDAEFMLARARDTRQGTEGLELVVEKLRALIAAAEPVERALSGLVR